MSNELTEIRPEEIEEVVADPFLMVVTNVDEETQTVTLSSVHDFEVPSQMQWFYGSVGIPCGDVLDQVGECYRITLEKLP